MANSKWNSGQGTDIGAEMMLHRNYMENQAQAGRLFLGFVTETPIQVLQLCDGGRPPMKETSLKGSMIHRPLRDVSLSMVVNPH